MFFPRRLADGNDSDFFVLAMAMAHNQQPQFRAQAKQDESVFMIRMLEISNESGEVIEKHGGSLIKVHAVFSPVRLGLDLVP
jgi:hypothetical protein